MDAELREALDAWLVVYDARQSACAEYREFLAHGEDRDDLRDRASAAAKALGHACNRLAEMLRVNAKIDT